MFAYAVETKKNISKKINQAGFAIIYVMALCAIVSALIAFSINYLSANYKSRETALKKSTITTIIKNLRNQLYEGTICPAVLGNGGNTVTLSAGAITPVQLNYAMKGGSGPTITAGWSFENSITINRIELKVLNTAMGLKNGDVVKRGNAFGPAVPYFPVRLSQSPTWPVPWVINPKSLILDKYLAEVRVVPENYPFNFTDENNVIRIYIKVTATGEIVQCHGETSEAESCEARGMSYDGIYAPVGFRCNPDFYCRKDIQIISTTPVCTAPFTQQLLSYEASTGNRWIICTWCNP